MADSIIQHSRTDNPSVADLLGRSGDGNGWLQVLRLAALCHDVGHGFMSHVSENALALTSEYRDLVFEFQRRTPKKKVASQLSEIAAYYMLTTDSFNELVRLAVEKTDGLSNIRDAGRRIAECVIGISRDAKAPLIHEFISGPFDCDKLDYMTRDAMMCGVPVVTDVTRLIQKARAAYLTTESLTDELQRQVPSASSTHTIVAIEHSGAGTLDEVALGRSLMHDKIYRHQKVRATEVMVASIIHEVLPAASDLAQLTLPLRLFDDDILNLTADLVAVAARSDSGAAPVAVDISRRIRDRNLFVRAFAFSKRMPDVPNTEDPDHKSSLSQLMADSRDSKKRLRLIKRIEAEATSMAALVDRRDAIGALPEGRLAPYVWLSAPPDKDSSTSDVLRGYLVKPDGSVSRLEEEAPAIKGVSDAYLNSSEIGYVFCPDEFVDLVYLATEVALFEEYEGLVIPRSMGTLAHVDMKRVADLRKRLAAAGFYDNKPRVFRPEPESASNAAFVKRCQAAARRLASYQGPYVRDGADRPGFITEAGVREWVCQFPEEYIEDALRLVESILVIDRDLVNKVLEGFLDSDAGKSFQTAAVVPLGSPKDSSAILPYYTLDLSEGYEIQAMTLADALFQADDRPIILVDDIIQRGLTVAEIIAGWLGVPPLLSQDVDHGGPLSKSAKREMKKRRLAIVAVAGAPEGIAKANEVLKHHGLNGIVHCHYSDFTCVPRVSSALKGVEASHLQGFVDCCRSIGRQLVGESPKTEERAFGYGGQGLLVTGTFNPPTASLTALWQGGDVNGARWRPLLHRRKKR
jgi:HD superfamily phosphohydrolase